MPQPAATEHPDAPTVGQLCKVLARFPDDHVAVLSQDADGRAGRVPADDVAQACTRSPTRTAERTRRMRPWRATPARQRFSAIPKDAIRQPTSTQRAEQQHPTPLLHMPDHSTNAMKSC